MGSPPAFSVVVPTFNIAEHLAPCLDSILGQTLPDFEVIVVDDASTDTSLAVARRYAERDPRITILMRPVNTGLGEARNVGLDVARAPYVLFVDGDDLLCPGALRVVADRIDQVDVPDVVMFGYEWSFPDGRVVPDPKTALLLRNPGLLDVEQRIPLLRILPVAWNKAYRREYLLAYNLRFPTGVYEDVPWTCRVLMTAERLATVDRVCYQYRQRPDTSLLGSVGRTHFDLIAQYGRVFDFLDAHPELDAWRRPLLDRMAWHLPTVLENRARIAPADRRAYFQATAAAIRRHRPSGYRPQGRLGLKVWLLEHSGYRIFRLAQLGNQLRRKLVGLRDRPA